MAEEQTQPNNPSGGTTPGERETPGGPGGGTPDKSGPGTDKSGTGKGGDKPGR